MLLPRSADPAIALSLKRGLEELLAAALALPGFDAGILQKADDNTAALTGLVVPGAPLIEECIRRRKTAQEIFAHGDWLTAGQFNALQAVPSARLSHPTSDWKRQGRIFGVKCGNREYFAGMNSTLCASRYLSPRRS